MARHPVGSKRCEEASLGHRLTGGAYPPAQIGLDQAMAPFVWRTRMDSAAEESR